MKRGKKRRGQMSDSVPVMLLLTLSGGLQDAYSYGVRGKVFANAQTGNIVLFSEHLFSGEFSDCLRYFVPVLFFALGVAAAEQLRARCGRYRCIHWRQLVAGAEMLLLFAVGFMPEGLNWLANALTSFSCAMQVQAFRKVNGSAYASTMCIGNLRNGMEHLSRYARTGEREHLRNGGRYLGIILVFALGAGLGGLLCGALGRRAIWISCLLLAAGFGLMFLPEEKELLRELEQEAEEKTEQ